MNTDADTHRPPGLEMEVALYRLLRVPGLSSSALGRVLVDWRADPQLRERFWHLPGPEYRRRWRLTAPAIHFLQSESGGEAALETAEREASGARDQEIELLSLVEPWYAALAASRGLAPLLFTRGNQDLLGGPGAAIVHSRDASEAALAWGAGLAAELAAAGVLLVSSQNRDGYRRVAAAAKRQGTPLAVVLDRPLHSIPAAGPLAEPVLTGRLWDPEFRPEQELLVSAVRPGEAWQPRHARERDALVIRLAALTIVGDVRAGGNIAALVAQAAAEARPVLLSPFCRAPLPGELLSESPEAAAARVLEWVRCITDSALARVPASGEAPSGWSARRREQALTRFIQTLNAELGGGYRVERQVVGDVPIHLADRGRVIVAIIRLPGFPGDVTEGGILVLGPPGGTVGRERQVLVLAPPGPLCSVQDLSQYLRRCGASLRDALAASPQR